MQSGSIKYWNKEKGYGFIAVDRTVAGDNGTQQKDTQQNEDVFFHISKTRLVEPIHIGQRVYFNVERNSKSQLRATEVTDAKLSLLKDSSRTTKSNASSYPDRQPHRPDKQANPHLNSQHKSQRGGHNAQNPHKSGQQHLYKSSAYSKSSRGGFSKLLSLLAIFAIGIYLFTDFGANFLDSGARSLENAQSGITEVIHSKVDAPTSDSQVDKTIALIQQGGPFPYPHKDGTTFYNLEGRLPAKPRGYYREYTVPTPGLSHRGAKRIVTGGNPPTVYYLTLDHYDSFTPLEVN